MPRFCLVKHRRLRFFVFGMLHLQSDSFFCNWGDCSSTPFATELDCYNHVIQKHAPSASKQRNRVCRWKSVGSVGECQFYLKCSSRLIDHIGLLHVNLVTHFSSCFKPISCAACCVKFRNRQDYRKHKCKHIVFGVDTLIVNWCIC